MIACLKGEGEPAATMEDIYNSIKWVSKVYRDNNF